MYQKKVRIKSLRIYDNFKFHAKSQVCILVDKKNKLFTYIQNNVVKYCTERYTRVFKVSNKNKYDERNFPEYDFID